MVEPKPQHLSPTSHEHDSFQKVLCPSQAAELHGASGKLSEMKIHPLLSAANFSERDSLTSLLQVVHNPFTLPLFHQVSH